MRSRSRSWCGLSGLERVLILLLVLVFTVCLVLLVLVFSQAPPPEPEPEPEPGRFLVGVGRADVTGPLADIPLMGYANPSQLAAGLLSRLYSRAFIIDDGLRRILFITVDIGMISQRLRLEVLQALEAEFGGVYRRDNVALSGSHTHCGPAGYFQYTLFMLTSKGYVPTAVKPLVQGILKSVRLAHGSLRRGRIFRSRGRLDDSSRNRSPQSYLRNPEEERRRYRGNKDDDVTVLKFTDEDGDGIGMLSWFAVHAVSLNSSNQMVSSDNVGHASILMETHKNRHALPGQGDFVAAFSSSNLGDVSPNTQEPICINTGLSCSYLNSSCPLGGTSVCRAFGPGVDMFDSTRIIGERLFAKAKELYAAEGEELTGRVMAAHQWVNMTDVTVTINDTHTGRTCLPALGHSFAAGTTDGGGELNFTQGAVEGDPFWDGIRDALLGKPSNQTTACHQPKPILLSTGEMSWPLPWHPQVVDVQILLIGRFAIAAVPGEFTTMAGRRLREAVEEELRLGACPGCRGDVEAVLAGLSNVYTHYITTYEEYQLQRYEGASTIYGPYTLSAYLKKYRQLAKAIAQDRVSSLPSGPAPPFFPEKDLFNLLPAPPIDGLPANRSFGDVVKEVMSLYRPGDVATVTFVAGNPRNSGDIREKDVAVVEKYDERSASWEVVLTDACWEIRFLWLKGASRRSTATVEWHIGQATPPGRYRIRHFGHSRQIKNFRPVVVPYVGQSDAFTVANSYYH